MIKILCFVFAFEDILHVYSNLCSNKGEIASIEARDSLLQQKSKYMGKRSLHAQFQVILSNGCGMI